MDASPVVEPIPVDLLSHRNRRRHVAESARLVGVHPNPYYPALVIDAEIVHVHIDNTPTGVGLIVAVVCVYVVGGVVSVSVLVVSLGLVLLSVSVSVVLSSVTAYSLFSLLQAATVETRIHRIMLARLSFLIYMSSSILVTIQQVLIPIGSVLSDQACLCLLW